MTAVFQQNMKLHKRTGNDGNSFMWLEQAFYLHPTDECVRYFLTIDQAPENAALFINGQHVADNATAQPYSIDITDYVALEDNTLALRVEKNASTDISDFGGVRLTAEPCE